MEQTQNAQDSAGQTKAERWLRFYLRLVGTSGLFAFVAVVMPYSWMDAIHQSLGMGKLPTEPVVGYLARSTSAFYAVFGGLLWTLSFHIRQSGPVLGYIGKATIVFGIMLLGVDFVERMPWSWTVGEGPINVLLGVIMLVLRAKVHVDKNA